MIIEIENSLWTDKMYDQIITAELNGSLVKAEGVDG